MKWSEGVCFERSLTISIAIPSEAVVKVMERRRSDDEDDQEVNRVEQCCKLRCVGGVS